MLLYRKALGLSESRLDSGQCGQVLSCVRQCHRGRFLSSVDPTGHPTGISSRISIVGDCVVRQSAVVLSLSSGVVAL